MRLIVGSIGERIRIQSVYLHERSTFDAFSGSTGGDGSVKTRRRNKRHGFRFESRGDCILLRGADEFRDPSPGYSHRDGRRRRHAQALVGERRLQRRRSDGDVRRFHGGLLGVRRHFDGKVDLHP